MARAFKPLTTEETQKAFELWVYRTHLHEIHKRVFPFYSEQIQTTPNDWINEIKRTLQFSDDYLAKKMNISRNAFKEFGNREEKGTITLEKMKQIAEAMDCEFVYAIRPKNKKSIPQIVWEQIFEEASKDNWLQICDQNRRHIALIAVINKLLNDRSFRKKKNWSFQKFEPVRTFTNLGSYKNGRWTY